MDLLSWKTILILDPQQRVFLPYVLVSSCIAAYYLRSKSLPYSQYFSWKLWFHKSAKLDYLLLVASKLLQASLLLPMIPTVSYLIEAQLSMLHRIGYVSPLQWSSLSIIALYSLSIFMANDLSRFICHLLMHKIGFLWNFHRVHHSASVLTPMTFYRVHPVESMIYGFRYALVTSCVTALFIFLFGAQVQVAHILGVNASVILAQTLMANLRHSHVPISFYHHLEKIFISPRQHQIHHQASGCRYNFGSTLAIWDYLANSLKLSCECDVQPFGIDIKTMMKHDNLLSLFLEPFTRSFKQLLRRTDF